MTPCDKIQSRIQPLGFQISGQVFEIKPEDYLHQAEGNKCQFAIHQNELKGSTSGLYLIGDIMLRHLYQVYDFEQETISLGVNSHSDGKILMYEAGKRPQDAVKLGTSDDNILDSVDKKAHFGLASGL